MLAFLRWMLLMLPFAMILGAQYGPKMEPAAMGSSYNPLLWKGDDAKFALDMMHSSYCASEISKAVAVKTSTQAVQNLALTTAHDQEKIFKKLQNMARTFDFPLPSKRDVRECAATARLKELDGHELESAYLDFLKKNSVDNVSRFESEVALPRGPSNWSLWAFAEKTLPVMREDAATVENVQQSTARKK